MVRIMATENREQYDENQAILIETVQTVRDYLNKELGKYEIIIDVPSHIMNLLDGTRQEDLSRLKSKGVGQTTILKFLGAGWKQWKIQHALEVLNSEEINPEAVKEFETTDCHPTRRGSRRSFSGKSLQENTGRRLCTP